MTGAELRAGLPAPRLVWGVVGVGDSDGDSSLYGQQRQSREQSAERRDQRRHTVELSLLHRSVGGADSERLQNLTLLGRYRTTRMYRYRQTVAYTLHTHNYIQTHAYTYKRSHTHKQHKIERRALLRTLSTAHFHSHIYHLFTTNDRTYIHHHTFTIYTILKFSVHQV